MVGSQSLRQAGGRDGYYFLRAKKKGARLRDGTLFEGTVRPATEDFDDCLDLRLKILPRLEGVPDRGDL